MAGTQVNLYSQSNSDILEVQLTLDQTRKGLHQVSLTNYDNTSLPAIAAGSVIEVNGALYKFTSEEAITGSPSDGTVYIYIDPATITAVFTNTAPTWSDSKQGWYGTSATVNCRYLQFRLKKSSALWESKATSLTSKNDIILYASDATERTTTSISNVNETNMGVTFNVKKGCFYNIILIYDAKVSAGTGYIRNGDSTFAIGTNKFLYGDIIPADKHYRSQEPEISFVDATTYFGKCMINSEYLSVYSGSYTYNMSWAVTTGNTVYVKNREVYIMEITNKSL